MIQDVGILNGMLIMIAILIGFAKNSNLSCFDLTNNIYIENYHIILRNIISTPNDVFDFNSHYNYSNTVSQSNVYLKRVYQWSYFNSIINQKYGDYGNYCSGTTFFQLLCYLVLDYNKPNLEKNNDVIGKISNETIREFFINTQVDNFNPDGSNIIIKLHEIFSQVRDKIPTIFDNPDEFISLSYQTSSIKKPLAKELPAHPIVILILLDIIFNLNKYFKSDTNDLVMDDPTYQDFYDILKEINPDIPISNEKRNTSSLKSPELDSSMSLKFVIKMNILNYTGIQVMLMLVNLNQLLVLLII